MTLFDQIRKDIEVGTPGPWPMHECTTSHVIMQPNAPRKERYLRRVADIPQWSDKNNGPTRSESAANARRIARVPQLEAIALASNEIKDALQNIMNGIETGVITSDCDETFSNAIRQANSALTAFNKAVEDG